MTLSRKLREIVCKKLGIGSRQLRNRITERARKAGIIDRDVALLLLAHESGISVKKPQFKSSQSKLDALDRYLARKTTGQGSMVLTESSAKSRASGKNASKEITVDLGKGLKITDPLLPKKLIDEAARMAGVYPVVYVFENSVRNLVSSVMATKYSEKWWDVKVGAKVKETVRDRMEKEDKNRWHGKRGVHPIFYTDIGDLKSIITANWPDFQDIFPNQQWVAGKIDEIEMSRNVIAHNNPLEERDVTRLQLNLQDWVMQIARWTEKGRASSTS